MHCPLAFFVDAMQTDMLISKVTQQRNVLHILTDFRMQATKLALVGN
jgi:hypothetical protein